MRARPALRLGFGCLLALVIVALVPGRAGAELNDEQQTRWGASGDLGSRTVNAFSSLTWAVESMGGTVFYGGRFARFTNGNRSIERPYLAAVDAGTGVPVPWFDPAPEGGVLALEPSPDGGLFVGGEMGRWDGVQIGALQKIDPNTGAVWPGWRSRVYGGNSVIRDMSMGTDGWLYIVGSFTTATEGNGPIAVSSAIRMNPTTGDIDEDWKPQFDGGAVWGVSRSQTTNRVYLAGWFTSVNGDSSAHGFASVDADNAALISGRTFSVNVQNRPPRIYDVVATTEGTVFVAGEQHALWFMDEADLSQKLMHFTSCTGYTNDCTAPSGNGRRAGGEFQEVVQIGNRVYATCHCWQDHLTSTDTIHWEGDWNDPYTGEISTVAAYNPTSGERIRSFEPYMSGDVGGFSIAGASDGCLWIAGGVNAVGPFGNAQAARDVVRLCDEAGPGPDPQPDSKPASPTTCSAIETNGTAVVSWSGTGGDKVVVERSLDDVNWFWRGSATDPVSSYTDAPAAGTVTRYRVRSQWGSVSSEPKRCWPNVDLRIAGGPALPPVMCSASNAGVDAELSWAPSADAVKYRIRRSVNGSSMFWRGTTTQTTFDDTLRSAGVHAYAVEALGSNGAWSSPTSCGPDLVANPAAGGGGGNADAPATCLATNNGVDATISWDPAARAVEYRIHRSIDGGTWFWRGRTSSTTDDDTLRGSGLHLYGVQAKGTNGVWSARTECAPPLNPKDGAGLAAVAPASCSATAAGADGVITWPASANATEYRIYRSIDGSRTYWRGKTTATTTTDPLRTTGVHTYSVQAKGPNGQWSSSTVCAPAITR